MNYPPNTRQWKKGDLVLHDADAKQQEMLMVVLRYNRTNGHCLTRYQYPGALRPGMPDRKVYANELRYLHDPALFGVEARAST